MMDNKLCLQEQWFDDPIVELPTQEVEQISVEENNLEGPEQGPELGVATLLKDLIIDIYAFTNKLDVARVNSEDFPVVKDLINTLLSENMSAIGRLQQTLSIVSPNAENINNSAEEIKVEIEANSQIENTADLDNQFYKVEYLDTDKNLVECFYKASQISNVIKHVTESFNPYLILGVSKTDFSSLSSADKKQLFESLTEV